MLENNASLFNWIQNVEVQTNEFRMWKFKQTNEKWDTVFEYFIFLHSDKTPQQSAKATLITENGWCAMSNVSTNRKNFFTNSSTDAAEASSSDALYKKHMPMATIERLKLRFLNLHLKLFRLILSSKTALSWTCCNTVATLPSYKNIDATHKHNNTVSKYQIFGKAFP